MVLVLMQIATFFLLLFFAALMLMPNANSFYVLCLPIVLVGSLLAISR